MKKPSPILRSTQWKRMAVMLTSVSTVALVSGCGMFKNPFSSNRPDQIVAGERRVPLLQGSAMHSAGSAPAPQMLVPSQTPPMAAPMQAPQAAPSPALSAAAAKADPYDYYSAAATEPAPQDKSSGKILGTLNPAPVRADTAAPRVRKPLPGNMQHEAFAPQPVAKAAPAPANYAAAPSQPFDASMGEPVSEKAAAAEAAPAPAKKASFFERVFGSGKQEYPSDGSSAPWKARDDHGAGTPAQEMESAGGATDAPVSVQKDSPYPSLSSVPEAPSEFRDVKSSRDNDVQALRAAHARAGSDKQKLDSEPSQQKQNVTPVDMPAATPVPQPEQDASQQQVIGHATAPADSLLQNAPQTATPAAQPESSGPRAPQRGVDIMTQEEWEKLQKTREQGQVAPPPSQAQPAPESPAPQSPEAVPESPQKAEPQAMQQQIPADSAAQMSPAAEGVTTAPANDGNAQQPNWWDKWGGAKEPPPPEQQKPAGQPQSALPDSSNESHVATNTEDASWKRPSFFERLFGTSPKQAESADASSHDASDSAGTDSGNNVVELAKPAAETKEGMQANVQRPLSPAELRAQRSLVTPPAALQEPAPAVAENKQEEPKTDKKPSDWLQSLVSDANANDAADKKPAAEEKLDIAAPQEKPAQAAAEAMPVATPVETVAKPAPVPVKVAAKEPTKKESSKKHAKASAKKSGKVKEPVMESHNTTPEPASGEPQVLGQMTDSTMIKLVDQPADGKTVEKVAAETPAAEPAKEEKPSIFSKLFKSEPKKEEPVAKTEEPAAPVAEEKPVVAEAPAQEPQKEQAPEKPSLLSKLFKAPAKQDTTEDKAAASPSFGTRLNTASDNPPAEKAKAAEPAKEEAKETDEKKPSFLSKLFDKKKTEDADAAAVPADGSQPAATTPLISASAPVTQVTTGNDEPQKAPSAGNSASSLPSPQILKEIKMMPASRYSARRAAQPQSEQ